MPVLPPAAPKRASRLASFLAACAVLASFSFTARGADVATAPAGMAEHQFTAEKASSLLGELARDVDACMTAARPVLLGSRDPAGPSCVRFVNVGEVKGPLPPSVKQSIDGGPGMRIGAVFLEGFASKTPKEHYAWHQVWLRLILESFAADNKEVAPAASRLAEKAGELARGINSWTVWPEGFAPAAIKDPKHWPGRCLKSLNEAIAAKDLASARLWSNELASATFALADLHRWLGFLLDNHLAAIQFQAKGESLFTWADKHYTKYIAASEIDLFPSGMLTLHSIHNYLEVERQAELLFHVPRQYEEPTKMGLGAGTAALWMPPDLRGAFVTLRGKLSETNRSVWDLAARSPFERSYLANMLFRAAQAKTIDQLGVVLERFSKANPESSVSDLMDVLMYRGHSFAGFEWADRFDPRLMKAAGDLSGSDEEVLLGAYRFTNALYGGFRNYGNVLTLRDALDKKKLDCVRGTDMIASLYRNAGHAGAYHVRWCSGTEGHTVAAAEVERDGKPVFAIVDAMVGKTAKCETWPDAYYREPPWPQGLEANPPPYSVELYGRGLDNYVWVEGYIIRDTNAGLLMKAAVPYLPSRQKTVSVKAFDGPYPQTPKAPVPETAE